MAGRDGAMAPRRYTAAQARLIVTSPPDGSQDFYVSVMVGMPLSMVAAERMRLMRALRGAHAGRRPR